VILKQPIAVIDTNMADLVAKYISPIKFAFPIRYVNDLSLHAIKKDEVMLSLVVFDSCPSVQDFIYAIEKKMSRASNIDGRQQIIPLCIVLLCSKSYAINSRLLESVDDTTIEYCWECLQFISMSVDSNLQEWLTRVMAGRTCVEYSALYCATNATEPVIKNVPQGMIGRRVKFHPIDISETNAHKFLWHRSDVAVETMLVHMDVATRAVLRDSKGVDKSYNRA
jgi:hypothetical protein